jgi:hypothetical protein
VSSIRRIIVPPFRLAYNQLKMKVRALPMWRYPVGEGAKRTRSMNAQYSVPCPAAFYAALARISGASAMPAGRGHARGHGVHPRLRVVAGRADHARIVAALAHTFSGAAQRVGPASDRGLGC